MDAPWLDFREWLSNLLKRLAADYRMRLDVAHWSRYVQHLVDSAVVVLIAWVVLVLVRWLVYRTARRLAHGGSRARQQRVATVASLVVSTLKYTAFIVAGVAVLAVWQVPTESLVVGTAVIGGALGFGSQGLVQDIITGLSILAEEQLAVGDYVEISGKAGAVEEVGLRAVKIRDALGVQHIIFNRTIGLVSNYTTASTQAVVDVSLDNVAAGEAAVRVAGRVCQDLAAETPFFPRLPEIEGVLQSTTHDVFLRLHLRVLPQQQDAIQQIFVDRLKRAFAAEGIIIPDGRVRVIIVSDLFKQAIQKANTSETRLPAQAAAAAT